VEGGSPQCEPEVDVDPMSFRVDHDVVIVSRVRVHSTCL
jgi:hypothetical protein